MKMIFYFLKVLPISIEHRYKKKRNRLAVLRKCNRFLLGYFIVVSSHYDLLDNGLAVAYDVYQSYASVLGGI